MSNIIGGNYNFGVWNPPTGLDAVRYSEQLNFGLACEYNNLQTGKEEGFKQNLGVIPLEIKNPDMDLIIILNDNQQKVFTGMTRQGWGGRLQNILPTIKHQDTEGYPPNPVTPIDIGMGYDPNIPIKPPNLFFLN